MPETVTPQDRIGQFQSKYNGESAVDVADELDFMREIEGCWIDGTACIALCESDIDRVGVLDIGTYTERPINSIKESYTTDDGDERTLTTFEGSGSYPSVWDEKISIVTDLFDIDELQDSDVLLSTEGTDFYPIIIEDRHTTMYAIVAPHTTD